MKALHLFDWYLPSTLSWVGRLLSKMSSSVRIQVAAPWIVDGAFADARFDYLKFPLQKWFFTPQTEWQYAGWQKWFSRSQRFAPSYPAWLRHHLKNNPPDILHAHFGPTGCLYLPLARQLDRPLVVTFYGFDYQKILNKRPVFRTKYRELFAQAAKVVAASPTGCQALETMGCPAEKLTVVRPSPDLQRFPLAGRQKIPGRLRLLQVATFTGKKGHLTTLEAFRQALADCPNLSLTLAGERYDKALVREVLEFIETHDLAQNLDWKKFVPHDQMAGFLAGFDAFIHPSQTTPDGDHEATPVALLEAQATGLPVLATNHFDLADEVAHGVSGLLVPEGDAIALAEAIRRFYWMENSEFQQFSQNARLHVETHFTVEKSAAALLKLYQNVLVQPT